MGGRRHPVLRAAVLSGFVVRAVELAAAIDRGRQGNPDRPLTRALARDLSRGLDPASGLTAPGTTRERISRALDLACKRSRALDRVCVQGAADRLGILPAEGLAEALLDGAMDDFTNADLTSANLADTDVTGVRWSLSGTTWPSGANVKKLLARSEQAGPGGVLVITRRGIAWPP